jgi:predicted MPP superfamily phosphohydrolase
MTAKAAVMQRLSTMRWPLSVGELEIGLRRALHVREERLSTRPDACRLLYVSDVHLRKGRSDTLIGQVLKAAAGCVPNAVLLGGDLVDCSSQLGSLRYLIGKLREVAPVLAIGGNHDSRAGMDRVGDAVERAGGQWIHQRAARVTHGSRVIAISGPEAGPCLDGDVRILCAHSPRVWTKARNAGYDLVLAGHLHGCQLVAWEFRDCLFPGAMLYPHCFLRHQRGATRLVVSRGVSDLVPVRWRCPREVVLCCV